MSTWKPWQSAADEHAALKAKHEALKKQLDAMEAMTAWKAKKSGSVTFAQGGAVYDTHLYRKPKTAQPTPEDRLWDE